MTSVSRERISRLEMMQNASVSVAKWIWGTATNAPLACPPTKEGDFTRTDKAVRPIAEAHLDKSKLGRPSRPIRWRLCGVVVLAAMVGTARAYDHRRLCGFTQSDESQAPPKRPAFGSADSCVGPEVRTAMKQNRREDTDKPKAQQPKRLGFGSEELFSNDGPSDKPQAPTGLQNEGSADGKDAAEQHSDGGLQQVFSNDRSRSDDSSTQHPESGERTPTPPTPKGLEDMDSTPPPPIKDSLCSLCGSKGAYYAVDCRRCYGDGKLASLGADICHKVDQMGPKLEQIQREETRSERLARFMKTGAGGGNKYSSLVKFASPATTKKLKRTSIIKPWEAERGHPDAPNETDVETQRLIPDENLDETDGDSPRLLPEE